MKSLIVIAHNIRSLHNVGAIFRTAEGAGVNKIYLTGYSGYPPRKEISKVALGSEKRMSWEYIKNISLLIKKLKQQNYSILALEQDKKSVDYKKFKPKNKKIALIIGNEVRGVSKQLRNKADNVLEIFMFGNRKSLNVSVAFGIAIFELKSKL